MTVKRFCDLKRGDTVLFKPFGKTIHYTVRRVETADNHSQTTALRRGEVFITFVSDNGYELYISSTAIDKIKKMRLQSVSNEFDSLFDCI